MTSQAYIDIVGEIDTTRRWPASYAMCITRSCPNCGARILDLCINPITGFPRKMPCKVREIQGWG